MAALSENVLFGMGNPLLDICAVVDKDFLDKTCQEWEKIISFYKMKLTPSVRFDVSSLESQRCFFQKAAGLDFFLENVSLLIQEASSAI